MGINLVSFWQSKSKKMKAIIVAIVLLPSLTISIFKIYPSVFRVDKMHIILSINQKEGMNIAGDVIINKTPECKANFKVISTPKKLSENSYEVTLQLEIQSVYSISTFILEVRAPTLTKMSIVSKGPGIFSYRYGIKKGYAIATIPNAHGVYEITLLSEKSERFFNISCRKH